MKAIRQGIAVTALFLCAAAAHADGASDTWSVAKGAIVPTPFVVMGVNVALVKNTSLFQQLYPALLAKAGEAQKGLDKVKTSCGIDVLTAVQAAVVAVDESQKGAIYVSAKGIDSPKIVDCLNKLTSEDKPGKKVTAGKPDGQGIVEYSADGEDRHFYVAFPGKGVLVFSTDATDKALLQKWLNGHGAATGTPTAKALSSVNTNAAVWMVITQEKALQPEVNATMKAIYGTAEFAGGSINGDFRIIAGSPKEASDLSVYAQKQLEDAKKSQQLPPAVATVMKTVKVAPSGSEIQIKASLPEADALGLIQAGLGGGP